MYFSNRSAAHAALKQWEDALRDANSVLSLRPGWVKGHARQAAALFGLQQYGAAKEAYQKALRLEPDDQALQRGLEKVRGCGGVAGTVLSPCGLNAWRQIGSGLRHACVAVWLPAPCAPCSKSHFGYLAVLVAWRQRVEGGCACAMTCSDVQ